MTAVLVLGIVLAALGVILLIAGVLYPNRGDKDRPRTETDQWDIIDKVVSFIIELFKQLLGRGSARTKVLILGIIFFIVGIGLVIIVVVG